MNRNEFYIQRCIDLAKKGLKSVAPNPMVGCVIVNNDRVIAESYHIKYGEAHAEVNAIRQVKNVNLLQSSTLYVSLEPCAHFGKTPPCSNLIVEKKIPKVVIACVDPFAEVAGKGIEMLRKNGVEVVVGVLEKKALNLNKRFFTFHKKKRPYIVLKWAQTADGFIDTIRTDNTPKVNWITHPTTKQLTDTWRSQEMAILVGKNTVLNDNPKLTVRSILGRNPIRLIIDRNCSIPTSFSIFDGSSKTFIFNHIKQGTENNVTYIKLPFKNVLNELLDWSYSNNIQSILVEGGKITLTSFIQQNLWDEARVYTGNTFFNQGLKAPKIVSNNIKTTSFGMDKLSIFYNKNI